MNNRPTATSFNAQAFFSYGFRPFFLFACLYAALGIAVWLLWIGMHSLGHTFEFISIALPPHIWHAHEMLYGYVMAVIAGFFLTAVPSWTDTRPVQGPALIVLVSLWVAGRVAIWLSAFLPVWLVAVLDLAFIPALFSLVIFALSKRWSKRNLIFIPILALLFFGNVLVHGELLGWFSDSLSTGHRLTLDTALLLIVLIGGRVIPAFTTNALRNSGHSQLPISRKPVEALAIGSMVALLIANAVDAPSLWVGSIALSAAVFHFIRLSGWRGLATLDRPIVWILHLGYLWLIFGFALIGIAAFSDILSEVTALHALTVGAIGSLTVGVLTRAGLGHTGRKVIASVPMITAYLLISAAAALRVLAPILLFEFYNEAMLVSGLLWISAFTILTWVFMPILTSPRPSSS